MKVIFYGMIFSKTTRCFSCFLKLRSFISVLNKRKHHLVLYSNLIKLYLLKKDSLFF